MVRFDYLRWVGNWIWAKEEERTLEFGQRECVGWGSNQQGALSEKRGGSLTWGKIKKKLEK